jgi:hypothetical protein
VLYCCSVLSAEEQSLNSRELLRTRGLLRRAIAPCATATPHTATCPIRTPEYINICFVSICIRYVSVGPGADLYECERFLRWRRNNQPARPDAPFSLFTQLHCCSTKASTHRPLSTFEFSSPPTVQTCTPLCLVYCWAVKQRTRGPVYMHATPTDENDKQTSSLREPTPKRKH